MRLENESEKKLKKDIKNVIAKRLDLSKYKLFVFGSRINNKGYERADIDIGIEGKKRIPAAMLFGLKEDIANLPYLYKIDLVDFKDVSDDFRQVALKKIEQIK